MKYSLLLLCLVASFSNAKEVITKGYGDTFDVALRNAKIAAIEQVTGTWINSEHSLRDGKTSETIVQYNGGVIKNYEVLQYSNGVIRIKADVDVVKDNTVGTNKKDISEDMRRQLKDNQNNLEKIKAATKFLDNRSKALRFESDTVQYATEGAETIVTVSGSIMWIPKWETDIRTLAQTINQKGSHVSNTPERIASGIISSLLSYNPFVGGVVASTYVVAKPAEELNSIEQMICFAENKRQIADECYIIHNQFRDFSNRLKINVVGLEGQTQIINKTIEFDGTVDLNEFYERFQAGDVKHGRFGVSLKYKNPTLAIYREQKTKVHLIFRVPTNELSKVERFDFKMI